MIELKPCPDFRARWPWIRKGIEKCLSKIEAHTIPEDVYVDLTLKKLVMFVIATEHDEIGWVMLQEHADYDGKAMFVYMLWGEGMAPHEDEIYAELEKLAKKFGHVRIRFHGRKGWKQRGWAQEIRAVYEREL